MPKVALADGSGPSISGLTPDSLYRFATIPTDWAGVRPTCKKKLYALVDLSASGQAGWYGTVAGGKHLLTAGSIAPLVCAPAPPFFTAVAIAEPTFLMMFSPSASLAAPATVTASP